MEKAKKEGGGIWTKKGPRQGLGGEVPAGAFTREEWGGTRDIPRVCRRSGKSKKGPVGIGGGGTDRAFTQEEWGGTRDILRVCRRSGKSQNPFL